MNLFYDPEIPDSGTHYLDSEEAHHALRVLRLKADDTIFVVNGKGGFFTCSIEEISKKDCKITINEKRYCEREKGEKNLHIAIGPPKNKERMEWFLEKCTEIGIREITPILCERAERKSVNEERMEKILVSAMKQSTRSYLPKLNPLTPFSKFVTQKIPDHLFIAHCDNAEKKALREVALNDQSTTILIGPEGDFTPSEIQMAIKNQFISVSLGTYRLRTETAGISACTIINYFK